MGIKVTRTIASAYLFAHKAINADYTPAENVTLNNLHNVHKDEALRRGESPRIAYVGFGNKGAKPIPRTNGTIGIQDIPHSPRDAGLYGPIPLLVRPLNDDISAEERSRYRMRVPFEKDGVNYVAYFLYAINVDNVKPIMEIRHVADGTSSIFVPVVGDLTPAQIEPSNIDYNNPTGDCLIASAKILLALDAIDIGEVINACTIMFGDPSYATVSEIALVSGFDRRLPGAIGSTTGDYTEVIAAQINAFATPFRVLRDTDTLWEVTFDLGSSELLLI